MMAWRGLAALACCVLLAGCSAPQTLTSSAMGDTSNSERHQERVALRVQLATAYWERGQYAVAQEEAQRALRLAPGDIDAQQVLALSQWSQGDRASAEQTFAQAIQAAPDHAELQRNWAWFQCSGDQWASGALKLKALSQAVASPRSALMHAQCLAPNDVWGSAQAFHSARQRWPNDEVVARIWAEQQWRERELARLIDQIAPLNLGPFASKRTQQLEAMAKQAFASVSIAPDDFRTWSEERTDE